MAYTVGDILLQSAILLNDNAQALYSNNTLLPYIKIAYDDLQSELEVVEHQAFEHVTAALTVPANTKILNSGSSPVLPVDIIEPVYIEERATGGLDSDYVKVTQRLKLPSVLPDTFLRWWTWTENALEFLGATQIQDIRIYYIKSLPDLTAVGNSLGIINCRPYLTYRVAALAAYFIGENPSRGQVLNEEADNALAKIITLNVKQRQNVPVRRIPFRGSRRRGYGMVRS